jgi:stage II sporulation protein AA (anti-sigma F factor antagonist)
VPTAALRSEARKKYYAPLLALINVFAASAENFPPGAAGARFVSMRAFKVTEEDFDSAGRALAIEGELDLAVAGRLQEALEKAAADGKTRLLVDLSACEFIDSTGIAVLMRAQSASPERKIVVSGAAGAVARVFSVTGLDEHGHFVADREEARSLLSLSDAA